MSVWYGSEVGAAPTKEDNPAQRSEAHPPANIDAGALLQSAPAVESRGLACWQARSNLEDVPKLAVTEGSGAESRGTFPSLARPVILIALLHLQQSVAAAR